MSLRGQRQKDLSPRSGPQASTKQYDISCVDSRAKLSSAPGRSSSDFEAAPLFASTSAASFPSSLDLPVLSDHAVRWLQPLSLVDPLLTVSPTSSHPLLLSALAILVKSIDGSSPYNPATARALEARLASLSPASVSYADMLRINALLAILHAFHLPDAAAPYRVSHIRAMASNLYSHTLDVTERRVVRSVIAHMGAYRASAISRAQI